MPVVLISNIGRLPGPAGVGFGGKGRHGLPPNWCRLCWRQITIPMRTDFDSLNLRVAAWLPLYHLAR